MTEDFVTTLRLQLREAAEREARRGPLGRAMPQLRPLVLAGALAAAAVVVALVIGTLGTTSPPPATTAPHIVARLAIADKGGALSTGFGSLWTYDAVSGDVLRLNADGTVLARIRTESDILDGWAGAGAMWALTNERLYRIDPKTDRVVARITLPLPTRSHTAVSPFPGAVWVTSPGALVHVDPRTNRIDRSISVVRGGQDPSGGTADETRLFNMYADGTLVTLDARTGRQLHVTRLAVTGFPCVAVGDDVILSSGAGVAAVDSITGKQRWRTDLGVSRVNGAAIGLGALWVQGTPVSGRDQLWKLDPRTGRVLAALPLSDFGVSGMTATRDRLWVMSPSGLLTGVR
jgi:hypothetical protein